jgi:tetraacyldisaccharide 4'-kinase
VSVGNLVVGGSGKTPLLMELAKHFEGVAIVLRGYGRESRGLVRVSHRGRVLTDVHASGDEAMLLAKGLKNASVYVSEDRKAGIEAAKKDGARVIFLDDAFHHCLMKFDILIDPKPPNPLCLPSGPYRLPRLFLKSADLVLREGKDFRRKVTIKNPTAKMVLLTAIANPDRLTPYLPEGIKVYAFEDHHFFTQKELETIWEKEKPTSFLVTTKDLVKLEKFSYPLSLLELSIELEPEVLEAVKNYVKRGFYAKKAANCPNAS